MADMSLESKTAMITEGGAGIGRGIALVDILVNNAGIAADAPILIRITLNP